MRNKMRVNWNVNLTYDQPLLKSCECYGVGGAERFELSSMGHGNCSGSQGGLSLRFVDTCAVMYPIFR